jgi:hypothetical protein
MKRVRQCCYQKLDKAVESPRLNARDSIRTMMVPSKALYNKSRKNTDHEREEKGGIKKRGASAVSSKAARQALSQSG